MQFKIGTTLDGKIIKVDSMVLADTRGLICASSGLGKSWLLRLIAENVASSIQTLIIDPEGEFSTLREKLDVLIVSENGDVHADIRSAGLLARKLAETGVSAVIDIYDLPGKEDPWVKRRMFASQFIGELMNLPKKLYHPMLVMVDEAHQFAQEETTSDTYVLNGVKVNPSVLSRSAIRGLMSAGRKRGIGGILATQRISKIDKDAIADARNVFIGGTTLDIDQRRAGDILGMNKAEFTSLRDLEPGTFFSFGPAVEGKGVIQFTSGEVKTTHPKAGQQRLSISVPKASTQISGIVEQFGDLPAIVEEETKTLETLKRDDAENRRQIAQLKKQLEAVKTVQPAPIKDIEKIEVPIISDNQMEMIKSALGSLLMKADEVISMGENMRQYAEVMSNVMVAVADKVKGYDASFAKRQAVAVVHSRNNDRIVGKVIIPTPTSNAPKGVYRNNGSVQADGVTGPMQRILDAIAWLESIGIENPKQVAVAFLANYSYGGGAYNNPRGALRSMGLVEYVGSESIRLTEQGRKVANFPNVPLTAAELQKHVMSVLPGPHQKILQVLLDKYPQAISKDECAALAGYAPGGAFNNPLGRLRSMGLVDYPQPGYVVAQSLLFLE